MVKKNVIVKDGMWNVEVLDVIGVLVFVWVKLGRVDK